MKSTVICNDTRKCFAKKNGKCICLSLPYEKDGECKFAKPVMSITNGTYYPIVDRRSFSKKFQDGEAV